MKKIQLFLLHFAGGNCYSFQFLYPLLNNFEIIPVELPGRGMRIREELIRDFDEAAGDIYQQIFKKLNGNDFMLYGHSMGASLALRVAHMLEAENKIPKSLLVSGNTGPNTKRYQARYLMNNADFIEEIKKLGGAPDELFESEDLLDFYLPILRADFEIVENRVSSEEAAVLTPIYSMMGDLEENHQEISNWGNYTKTKFNSKIFEGGHFFIHDYPNEIAEIINQAYDREQLIYN
ncbi:Surfactin synthase thioesterase subunit [Pedobacter steynii]|uniref:Surfactin synthase thioesterase subunit n=1 Tax=Pedobacter steynii TaxID=430522 RepID=A0A1G9V9B7_9SPHI|nr:alpha/beta fold hydrolase [Pedobacter steynii]NQX41019.1 thioesterase [Pedobacter steynii]SDM68683.1 Surfactin synthase thioesterase subunit [Pedobacter steynii]